MAVVQILLDRLRRQKQQRAAEEENQDPMDPDNPAGPNVNKIRPGCLEERIISGKLAFNKSLLQERLILEEAICFQLGRSFLFLTQFVILMIAFWLSYPAPTVLPIHQGLSEGLSIDGVMPEDVVTLNGLKDYLKGLSNAWRAYSPGSSVYMEDPLARSYLAEPTQTPPMQVVQLPQQPQIGGSFTVMAWIKTIVRYDTLLKKVQPTVDGAVCWQFEMERILYGQHETGRVEAVIHPAASEIWRQADNAATVWKGSTFRSQFEDGAWHHWAVVVDGRNVTFARDGEFYSRSVELPRPITDCRDGIMTLGSPATEGTIVDLKYIPRTLQPVELQFIRSKGKLLDDMLAGAGQPAVAELNMDALQRMVANSKDLAKKGAETMQGELMAAFRKLERAMRGDASTAGRRLKSSEAGSRAASEEADKRQAGRTAVEAAELPRQRGAGKLELDEAEKPKSEKLGSARLVRDLLAGLKADKRQAGKIAVKAAESPHQHVAGKLKLDKAERLKAEKLVSAGLLKKDLLAGQEPLKAAARRPPPALLAGWEPPKAAETKSPRQAQEAPEAPEAARRLSVCADSPECEWQMMGALLGIVRPYANQHDIPMLDCMTWALWSASTLFLTVEGVLGPGPDSIINPPGGACDEMYADQESSLCDVDGDCSDTSCAEAPPDLVPLGCHNGRCTMRLRDDACEVQPPPVADCDPGGGPWRLRPCNRTHLRRKLIDVVRPMEDWYCNTAEFAPTCMERCARCKVATAPSRQSTLQQILDCSDEAYEDWLGQSCAWYFFNDPPSATGGPCFKYGTADTRSACRLTCKACGYAESLINKFDQDRDGRIDGQERGALFLNIGQPVTPIRWISADEDPTIACEALYSGAAEVAGCLAANSGGTVDAAVLLHPSFGAFDFFDTAARDILRTLRPVANFLGLQSGAEVLRFPSPLRLAGSRNMALQAERAVSAFDECSAQGDCENQQRYACGNVMQALNSLCGRRVAVPLYCATKCFTGGCGRNASVLPSATGSFCQPCDACFVDEGVGVCPDWCSGYRVDSTGGYAAEHGDPGGEQQYIAQASSGDRPGSFTLMAWIKNFQSQWVFERRISLDANLSSEWEGYDPRTGELTCWQLGDSELRYRSRWSQRSMTVIDNPLKQVIARDPDNWHFLVLRKESIEDTYTLDWGQMTTRREVLRFFVDDAQSNNVTLPWGVARVDVPPYGFPDCGGEMLSIPTLSTEYMNIPLDLPLYPPWSWASQRDPNYRHEHYFPLAQGRNGMATFTFTNLDLPRGALIKTAQMSLCAGRNFLDWLDQNLTCMSRHKSKVRLTIAGLMTEVLQHHNEGSCQIAYQAGHLAERANGSTFGRTTAEVLWEVDVAEWRSKALVQSMFSWDVAPYTDDCTVFTPDLSPIVAEMLERAPGLSDLSLVFKEEEMAWGECPAATLFDHPNAIYSNKSQFDETPEDDECQTIRKYNELLNYAMPLFVIPRADNTNARSSVTTLYLQYCLNQECVSPAFLGSGDAATSHLGTRPSRRVAEAPHASADGEVTSIHLGVPHDQGMTSEGMLYKPVHGSRALANSEIQTAYYNGLLEVQKLTGPLPLVDAVATANAEIDQYPSEVVSIIPAVVFQTRSKIVPCRDFAPGLSASMDQYFYTQVRRKCDQSYTCEYPDFAAESATPSGFACIDRSQGLPWSENYLGERALEISEEWWYPEFLDLFSVPTVLRAGAMRETEDWIDVQTSKVMVINVFISPTLSSGTLLSIVWEYAGPGRLKGKTEMNSYVQMDPKTRDTWAVLTFVVIALAVLDLILIAVSWICRAGKRRRLFLEIKKVTEAERIAVKQNMPIVEPLDLFDVALRVANVIFCIMHYLHYPGPEFIQTEGEELRLERYDSMIKDILALAWDDPMRTTNKKVSEFNVMVVQLQEALRSDVFHRDLAKALVLAFFARTVVYTRVHPRIAILYKTLVVMMEDFMHFAILFFMLFFVLAFLGTYSFGDQIPDFADFGTTCYTQFRMLVGEFGLATGAEAGFDIIFGVYTVCYFFFSFSLLLNFFLAIVIDSYSTIIDRVKECSVEHMVIWDIPATLIYPVRALMSGYPQRGRLLMRLLRTDINLDGRNDEVATESTPVTYEHLVTCKVVPSARIALGIMKHYHSICPSAVIGYEEKSHGLEHQALQRRINTIDAIRAKYIREQQPKSEVDALPPGDGPPAATTDDRAAAEAPELDTLTGKIADAVVARMGSRI